MSSINRTGFELAFQIACRKNGVRAAYIIFDNEDPADPRAVRVLTGGENLSLALLNRIVAAGQFSVAADYKAEGFEARLDALFASVPENNELRIDWAQLKGELKALRLGAAAAGATGAQAGELSLIVTK